MTASPQPELPRILRSFRGLFVAVAAFSLAVNLLMLVPSLYMLQVYDRVLASRNDTTLLMLTLLMLRRLFGLSRCWSGCAAVPWSACARPSTWRSATRVRPRRSSRP